MKTKNILQNHIKEYRKKYNISADQLAQAIGISRVALYSIENHKAGPSAFNAGLICQYFGCKFEEMFDINDLKMADEKEEQIPEQMTLEEYQQKVDPSCINIGTKIIKAKPRKKAT